MNSDTKICATCQQEKSVDEFYFHRESGKPEKRCKLCKKKMQRKYTRRKSNVSGVPHERDIIQALKKRGIYACSGKRSRSRWVDIVAFGCVAIEAKLGKCKSGTSTYTFSFTKKQIKQGIRSDILIFMIENDDSVDYYILPKDNKHLFHGDGSRKQWVSFTPDSKHVHTNFDWNRDMEDAKDNWNLVLEVLNEKINDLKQGKVVDKFAS